MRVCAALSILLPFGPNCVGFNHILNLRMGTNPFLKIFFFFSIFDMRQWTECINYDSKWIDMTQDKDPWQSYECGNKPLTTTGTVHLSIRMCFMEL